MVLAGTFSGRNIIRRNDKAFSENRSSVLWGCIWCAVFGTALDYFAPILLPWSVGTVLLTEVLVATGSELKRYNTVKWIGERPWLILLVFLVAGLIRWQNGAINISIGIWGSSMAIGMMATLLASVGIMTLMWWLERHLPKSLLEGLCIVGQNTMPILCLHLFVFMFVQAGIQLFLPGFVEGKGVFYEAVRIGMVIVTVDIIVIGNLCLAYLRGRERHRKI